MLEIKNLHATVGGTTILRGLSLAVGAGEVHAIMGPNGSGKSTLANVIAGRDGYEVLGGTVEFKGKDLLDLDPEVRAHEGVFLAFQYPVEIPGELLFCFFELSFFCERVMLPVSRKINVLCNSRSHICGLRFKFRLH